MKRDEVDDFGLSKQKPREPAAHLVGSFVPAAIRIPRVLLPHNVELRLLLVAQ